MNNLFEDRIHKPKLPKGFSYVLQTKDIISILPTDGLSVSYRYLLKNPEKNGNAFTTIDLLEYSKYDGQLGSLLDYDTRLVVFSVPAKIRKVLQITLINEVLPILNNLNRLNISVYYEHFNRSRYKHINRGGLYVEQDKYKGKVLYHNKDFDIDKEVKEIL